MFFLMLMSLTAGFLLNEEASLRRLCQKLSYAHEGWLVLREGVSIFLLAAACIAALVKGVGWSLLIKNLLMDGWFLPASLYVLGNMLAVIRTGGLGYTPWLALIGILGAVYYPVAQGILTVIAVAFLLTRHFLTAWKWGRVSLFLLVFIYVPGGEKVWWGALLLATWIFSAKQALIPARIIEYLEKNIYGGRRHEGY